MARDRAVAEAVGAGLAEARVAAQLVPGRVALPVPQVLVWAGVALTAVVLVLSWNARAFTISQKKHDNR